MWPFPGSPSLCSGPLPYPGRPAEGAISRRPPSLCKAGGQRVVLPPSFQFRKHLPQTHSLRSRGGRRRWRDQLGTAESKAPRPLGWCGEQGLRGAAPGPAAGCVRAPAAAVEDAPRLPDAPRSPEPRRAPLRGGENAPRPARSGAKAVSGGDARVRRGH